MVAGRPKLSEPTFCDDDDDDDAAATAAGNPSAPSAVDAASQAVLKRA